MARIMKDSGIKWIGNIPNNWTIKKVKHGFIRKGEKAEQENPTVLSLARAGVKIRDLSNNDGQIAESYYNYNPVEPGDLLLNPMDLYSGANCSISKVSGVISPAYMNLKANKGYDPAYYDYYFKTQYWGMTLFAHGKGVSFDNRWTLGKETLMNYCLPYPNIEEQTKISSFLDQKCFEIDSVITKTEQTIEEYKKLKQSIITEAVTKGIRGDRPMKGTAIEWMGDIPNGWNCVSFKYLNDGLNTGESLDREYWVFDANENYHYFYTAGIEPICTNYNDFPAWKYTTENDILLARNGTPYVYFPIARACYSDHVIRAKMKTDINRKYVKYCLERSIASVAVDSVSLATWSASLWNIQKLPWHEKEEQKEIVDYLDDKCNELDRLINNKQKVIEELQSYKKSLIYEYVTGKKEVA